METNKKGFVSVNYSFEEYKLELRTSSKNIKEDNLLIEELAKGFLVFLLWNNKNENLILKNLKDLTKEELFKSYYSPNKKKFKQKLIHGLFIADNKDEEFVSIHLKNEQEHFNKIDNSPKLKEVFGSDYPFYSKLFEEYKSYLLNKISKPGRPQPTGLKKSLTDTQQTKLYKALQNNYIDCTEAEFKSMFTDNPKHIKWIKSNALLSFFVSDLFQKNNPNNYWSIAETIFIDKSNNLITSLRQSFQTAYNNNNQEPKGYQTLKNIYSHLL